MNIVISYNKFGTSKSGGAQESLLSLLNGVAGHQKLSAEVYQTPPVDNPPETDFEYRIHKKHIYNIPNLTWANQVIRRWQWKIYLREQLSSGFDFMITQDDLAPISVRVAKQYDIPCMYFIHSMPLTGHEKYDPERGHVGNLLQTDLGGRVQYPFLRKNLNDYKKAASEATYTIANSEYTAEKIEKLFGFEPEIIYPPINLEKYRVEYNESGFITMINPRNRLKGPDIFLDIAEELPDETFLLVGPSRLNYIEKRARSLSNVRRWEWCEKITDAYAKSKLVMVPSRWQEPFGRVPAEAMASGIPCVVSERGGLPEVVGETGEIVKNPENVNMWIEAIYKALTNHDPEAQIDRVKRFSDETQVEKMIALIDNIHNKKH